MTSIVGTCTQKLPENSTTASMHSLLRHELESEVFPRASVSIVRCCDGEMNRELQNAICERELTLVVNGEQLVVLLCSDVALRELAYGFLYSEGVIESLADVRSCTIDKRATVASFDLAVNVCRPACPTISSGFGGKMLHPLSSDFSHLSTRPTGGAVFTMSDVMKAVSTMRSFAREYTITRGIHCSALFRSGVPLASFEDVGRHNTFDKLAGRCLLVGQDTQGALLTTTGRISGEMVRKALRLGVSGVASLSGPTDKAIAIAQNAGILLAGYVSETSALVYAGLRK